MAKLPPPQINSQLDISPPDELGCPFRTFVKRPRVGMHLRPHERRESRCEMARKLDIPAANRLHPQLDGDVRKHSAPASSSVETSIPAESTNTVLGERDSVNVVSYALACMRRIPLPRLHPAITMLGRVGAARAPSRGCGCTRATPHIVAECFGPSASSFRRRRDVSHAVETRRSCLCAATQSRHHLTTPLQTPILPTQKRDVSTSAEQALDDLSCTSRTRVAQPSSWLLTVVDAPYASWSGETLGGSSVPSGRNAVRRGRFLPTCSAAFRPRPAASNAAIRRLTFAPPHLSSPFHAPLRCGDVSTPREQRRSHLGAISKSLPTRRRDVSPSGERGVDVDGMPPSPSPRSPSIFDDRCRDESTPDEQRRGVRCHVRPCVRTICTQGVRVVVVLELGRKKEGRGQSGNERVSSDVSRSCEQRRRDAAVPLPPSFSSPHLSSSDVTPLRCVVL
ncbi:hypothetical protein SCHPADRAFT_948080 [Schizopora paradoxa]|uniref:Uncharacterized protein n=1 Tax=Schizopora paradoxa TaxID=27342 RepID=A0A0H2QYI0_9AGAM|nr:hypothetical protein SCHPADRAFT_948080 [Schizopora paradoxa]